VRLGKQLKKNNVSVWLKSLLGSAVSPSYSQIDVINFGQENTENENSEILDAFVHAANSSGTRYYSKSRAIILFFKSWVVYTLKYLFQLEP
jgi:hypothetical protein